MRMVERLRATQWISSVLRIDIATLHLTRMAWLPNVITDTSGQAQAIDGGVTNDLWNPGFLLVFRYQGNMTDQ